MLGLEPTLAAAGPWEEVGDGADHVLVRCWALSVFQSHELSRETRGSEKMGVVRAGVEARPAPAFSLEGLHGSSQDAFPRCWWCGVRPQTQFSVPPTRAHTHV